MANIQVFIEIPDSFNHSVTEICIRAIMQLLKRLPEDVHNIHPDIRVDITKE